MADAGTARGATILALPLAASHMPLPYALQFAMQALETAEHRRVSGAKRDAAHASRDGIFHGSEIIVARMQESRRIDRVESELRRLEARVEELLRLLATLGEENRQLRQRERLLLAERAELIARHDQARARVESIIGRLKAMEDSA
ncbi:MAG TPA: TIGR02449 family protein [Gammaproteobacteria bacterium]|nr:TIGR02449 family protein [Gammaproteobacteria bacterium]